MDENREETNDTFDNISESLNTSFSGEVSKGEKLVTQVEEIVAKPKGEFDFEEGVYLKQELKSLVSNINVVMDLLKNDIRLGSPPRMYEVLGSLGNSKANALKELINIEKAILDAKVKMKKVDATSGQTTVNNSNLNSKDLLAMVNDVKKNNSLKEVKAEFKIGEAE